MQTYAKALLIDQPALSLARQHNDVAKAQEILQDAYLTDVRPLVAEARLQSGGALDPLGFYRGNGIRQKLITKRGVETRATGL